MTYGKHNLWVPLFEVARLGGDIRTDLRLHLQAASRVPGVLLTERLGGVAHLIPQS